MVLTSSSVETAPLPSQSKTSKTSLSLMTVSSSRPAFTNFLGSKALDIRYLQINKKLKTISQSADSVHPEIHKKYFAPSPPTHSATPPKRPVPHKIVYHSIYTNLLQSMQTGTQQRSFNLVLPTVRLPPALSRNDYQPQVQFILGYRNVITALAEGLRWGLVKSASHCARVFCYRLSEADTYNIQQLKGQDEYIENAGDNFIILKIEKSVNKPKEKLQIEVVVELLNEVGGMDKISLNLLKNSFESLEEYRRAVPVEVEDKVRGATQRHQLQGVERVQIEMNGKQLSGKNLLQVPVISKQSGEIVQNQTLTLKLLEH